MSRLIAVLLLALLAVETYSPASRPAPPRPAARREEPRVDFPPLPTDRLEVIEEEWAEPTDFDPEPPAPADISLPPFGGPEEPEAAFRIDPFADDVYLPRAPVEWAGLLVPRRSWLVADILRGPGALVDEGVRWLLPRNVEFGRVVLFDSTASREPLEQIFLRTVARREGDLFGDFESLELSTIGLEAGLEEVDEGVLRDTQRRVLMESARRAYKERYLIPALDLDTAVALVTRGGALDAYLVPIVISAYAVQFGVQRTIRIGDSISIGVRIERGTRVWRVFAEDSSHPLATLSVRLFRWPVAAICELEGDRGKVEFAFAGLGTDLQAALEAVNSERRNE